MLVANIKKHKVLHIVYVDNNVSNTAVETDLWSYTLNAGKFKVGDIIKIKASGQFTLGDATDNITLSDKTAGFYDIYPAGETIDDEGWCQEIEYCVQALSGSGDTVNLKTLTAFRWGDYSTFFNDSFLSAVDTSGNLTLGTTVTFNNARATTSCKVSKASVELIRM